MSDEQEERNVERLLRDAFVPVEAHAAFRERARQALLDEAARLRGERPAGPTRPGGAASPRLRQRIGVAAAAFLSAASIVVAVRAPSDRQQCRLTGVEPPASAMPVVATGRMTLAARPATTAAAVITDGRDTIARLELRDGAEVTFTPGSPPLLRLEHGFARIEANVPVDAAAADVTFHAGKASTFEIELIRQGDDDVMKHWLIPGATGAVAGALVAILVYDGTVETKTPESMPAVMRKAEEPVVLARPAASAAPAVDAALLAAEQGRVKQLEKRVADLEQKLKTAKGESERLAATLAEKNGVTIASLTAKLDDLSKSQLASFLQPGKLSQVIADIKGLGAEGVAAVVDMLKSEDATKRFLAAKILEDLADPSSIPALRDAAITDEDEMVGRMASHALALMDEPRVIESLREIASASTDWGKSVNAIWGLCKYNDPVGLEKAMAWMTDPAKDAETRWMLGGNMTLIADPGVMPVIDATMKQFGSNTAQATACINYYKSILSSSPEARHRLQAIADDASLPAAVRSAASKALE